MEKLENFVNLKEDTEHDLYSKFILILNEKKKRIEHLNELLEAYREGRIKGCEEESDFSCDSPVQNAPTKKNVSKRLELISDSDSDTDDTQASKTQIEPPVLSGKRKIGVEETDDESSKISLPKRLNVKEKLNIESDNVKDQSDNISDVSTSSYDSEIGPPFKLDKDKVAIDDDLSDEVIENYIPSKKTTEKENESSESVDFNTQDLMDRL